MPVAASAAVLAVWGAVAHDAGAGWAQAVGALVAGGLVVGMLAPAVAVARARCHVVSAPAGGTAGAAVVVEVVSSAPVEVQPLDPPGPVVMVPGRRHAALEVRPEHRGELHHVRVAISSAAPFGILWWTRTDTLALPRPVAVAPRVGRGDAGTRTARTQDPRDETPGDETPGTGPGRGAGQRGVRPYEPGDRRALVHWRATAHTGSLMVREPQRPEPQTATVEGLLPTDPDAAERHAERVMATVRALLLAGVAVELRTAHPEGEVVAPVTTMDAAGKRLARALPRTGAPWGRPLGGAPSSPASLPQGPE
jgi:uncharacterized protein (DUF58 family)